MLVEQAARRPAAPMIRVTLACVAVFLPAGCSSPPSATHDATATAPANAAGPHRPVTTTTPATSPAHADIHAVVQLAARGRIHEAIRLLLTLTRDDSPSEALRLSAWSEEQFVKLENWQAERDNLVAATRELNAVVHEILQRAESAAAAGDRVNAEQLLLAIKRLGAANIGSKHTKFADAYGQSLVRRADRGLAELGSREPTGAAAAATPSDPSPARRTTTPAADVP